MANLKNLAKSFSMMPKILKWNNNNNNLTYDDPNVLINQIKSCLEKNEPFPLCYVTKSDYTLPTYLILQQFITFESISDDKVLATQLRKYKETLINISKLINNLINNITHVPNDECRILILEKFVKSFIESYKNKIKNKNDCNVCEVFKYLFYSDHCYKCTNKKGIKCDLLFLNLNSLYYNNFIYQINLMINSLEKKHINNNLENNLENNLTKIPIEQPADEVIRYNDLNNGLWEAISPVLNNLKPHIDKVPFYHLLGAYKKNIDITIFDLANKKDKLYNIQPITDYINEINHCFTKKNTLLENKIKKPKDLREITDNDFVKYLFKLIHENVLMLINKFDFKHRKKLFKECTKNIDKSINVYINNLIIENYPELLTILNFSTSIRNELIAKTKHMPYNIIIQYINKNIYTPEIISSMISQNRTFTKINYINIKQILYKKNKMLYKNIININYEKVNEYNILKETLMSKNCTLPRSFDNYHYYNRFYNDEFNKICLGLSPDKLLEIWQLVNWNYISANREMNSCEINLFTNFLNPEELKKNKYYNCDEIKKNVIQFNIRDQYLCWIFKNNLQFITHSIKSEYNFVDVTYAFCAYDEAVRDKFFDKIVDCENEKNNNNALKKNILYNIELAENALNFLKYF